MPHGNSIVKQRLEESVESRATVTDSEKTVVTFTYNLFGFHDDEEAQAFLELNIPQTKRGYWLQSTSMEPVWVDTVGNDGLWIVKARYGPWELGGLSTVTESFDTVGQTTHITQSFKTLTKKSRLLDVDPIDFEGAIGVSHDSVEGVDVVTPKLTFSETHIRARTFIRPYTKIRYSLMSGTVNRETFRGFRPGEVLFLGASGSIQNNMWSLSFKFATSRNVFRQSFPGFEGSFSKKGWDYLWIRYMDVDHPASGLVLKKPIFLYVEEVYKASFFGSLGIGIGDTPEGGTLDPINP